MKSYFTPSSTFVHLQGRSPSFLFFFSSFFFFASCSQVYEPLQSKIQAQRQSASAPSSASPSSPIYRTSSGNSNSNAGGDSGDGSGNAASCGSRFASFLGLRKAPTHDDSSDSASSKANQKKKKKTVLHTRYLYGLFTILFVYVLYLGAGVNGRLGNVRIVLAQARAVCTFPKCKRAGWGAPFEYVVCLWAWCDVLVSFSFCPLLVFVFFWWPRSHPSHFFMTLQTAGALIVALVLISLLAFHV